MKSVPEITGRPCCCQQMEAVPLLPPPTDNGWLLTEPIGALGIFRGTVGRGMRWLAVLARILAPHPGGYRPKASGLPKPPPPPGRGPVIP